MPSHVYTIQSSECGQRLDVFLTSKLTEAPSRSYVKKLIDQGHVQLDGEPVKPHHKLHEGERVSVDIPEGFCEPPRVEPERIPLDIIHEDEAIIVINKPAGMLVHPAQRHVSATLVNALLYYSPNLSDLNTPLRAGIVHRLDKETSGVIVTVKTNEAHQFLAKQFKAHSVFKQYLAVVKGRVEFDEGIVDVPLGPHPAHHEKRSVNHETGKEALTRYKVVHQTDKRTYLELFPQTGRTHQLRVHMAHIGHPILGDEKYGQKQSFSRLALHAHRIRFVHPLTEKEVEYCAPVPVEFDWKV